MKSITLTQGKIAIIDDDMYDYLSQWKWYARKDRNTFYAQRTDRKIGKAILMHRVISKCKDGFVIDHIDGNGLNNQISNLRICTHAENCRNKGKHINNTSGYKGVKPNPKGNGWIAHLMKDGKYILNKLFSNKIDAAKEYDKTAKKHHGKFARLNFPND